MLVHPFFFFQSSVMNNNCEFLALFSKICSHDFLLSYVKKKFFKSVFFRMCVHISMSVKPVLHWKCATFVYVCVYMAANQCCYISFGAWCDSEQMAASFQRTDSWRKLELRAQVVMGKRGKTREVITIKPLQREHPSASFLPLGMWHRYKMPPRLIYRAARTLNKFILKLAVKQNQLFCI